MLVRGLATVLGVFEDVVDAERAARDDLRGPEVVVEAGRLLTVPAVDEEERQRRGLGASDDR